MSREVVALDLTGYAKTHVDTVEREYNYYVSKWETYLDLVADAHTSALDKVKNRFTKIRMEDAEARECVMMAWSVLGIVGAAWLGSMVEHVWAPKMIGKVEYFDKVEIDLQNRYIWRFGQKTEFSEIAAKTIGDSAHDLTGHVLDKVFETLLSSSDKAQMDTGPLMSTIRGAKLESFKSSLNSALRSQSGQILAQLAVLGEGINQHPNFGAAVIQVLESKLPRGTKLDDENLKMKGRSLLDEYFDALRQNYKKKIFYYGNVPNPARIPLFAFNVEIQAWAFWILDQDWKLKMYEMGDVDYSGYSNGEFDLGQIMYALRELAVEEFQDAYWAHEAGFEDELKAAAKLNTAATGTAFGTNERDVDADKDKLFAWAKSVPGQIEHPALDSNPREIGSIRGLKGVFPGIQIN